jgi:hypothetical protein
VTTVTPETPDGWTLRLVLAGGGPAVGVPVTLLDQHGDPAGHWMSDHDGQVRLPHQDGERIRVRLGLRNEDPLTLEVAALEAGVVEVTAPSTALPAVVERETAPRLRTGAATERPERSEMPGHLLAFARLLVAPAGTAGADAETGGAVSGGAGGAGAAATDAAGLDGPVDFFETPEPAGEAVRYGILLEMEQHWEPAGHAAGDLLYTAHVMPGEELHVAITDRRWAGGVEPERPIEAVAALVGDPSPLDGLRGDGVRSVEPLALVPTPSGMFHLGPAVAETAATLAERAVRAGHLLRRRALGVRIVSPGAEATTTVVRTLRNPQPDRVLAYHFYEALGRSRVFTRLAHARPVVLVPFRIPPLATRSAVRQFAPILGRVLLDPALRPELERVLEAAPNTPVGDTPPVSELRLIAHRAPTEHGHDLRRLWCFLHVDQIRYTVHFFPTDTPPGVDAPIRAGGAYFIGAIRLSDFHEHPLQFPGRIAFHNASREILSFDTLHLEGRAGDRWVRLKTFRDVVVPAQSQIQLASLAVLAVAPGVEPGETRILSHIAANLPFYAAAIVAGGDPGMRFAALARVRDPAGRPLSGVIENSVAGVVGTWAAFPLRRADYAPAPLRSALALYHERPHRGTEAVTVAVPLPGIWLATQPGEGWGVLPSPHEVKDEEPGTLRGRRWR